MKYTEELPTKPGWYWLRDLTEMGWKAEVVPIFYDDFFNSKRKLFCRLDSGSCVLSYVESKLGCVEWAGPIFAPSTIRIRFPEKKERGKKKTLTIKLN